MSDPHYDLQKEAQRDIEWMQSQYNPLENIETLLLSSEKDFSLTEDDAWLYGIIFGWSKKELRKIKNMFNWDRRKITRLERLHKKYAELSSLMRVSVLIKKDIDLVK